MVELYKKHRPQTLNRVIGQESAVKTLQAHLAKNTLPHTILFSGFSGCGKTSLARILKTELDCSDNDFHEVNCADLRGIDDARDIIRHMGFAPVGGKCRIWLLDECHQSTLAWFNSMLKALEDTPEHVYFFLCTTDPQKLPKTIKTRCTEIKLNSISINDLTLLVKKVAKKEEKEIPEDIVDQIAAKADGSARMALVLLDKICNLPDDQMEAAVHSTEGDRETVIRLCRTLLSTSGVNGMQKCCKLLKKIQEEPESIRYAVLGYMTKVMLSGKDMDKCYIVIDAFKDNFYDSKRAGLLHACYDVMLGE